MTPRERERKISELNKMRLDLSAEANNPELLSLERLLLGRAADALRVAVEAMEKKRATA